MNWQTNPGLPFSAEGAQLPMLNLNLNTPPLVPNYMGPPQLQQIVPLVSAALAIEIQQRAPSNPLRTFMFNQYGQNGFNNPDFQQLVIATMDFILLEMQNGRYPNVELAAQNCVPQMCEMMCAVNMRLFPDLERYITPQVVQPLRNHIANFDSLAQRINAMKSGVPMQTNQWSGNQGNWGGMSGGAWGGNQAGYNSRWNSGAPQPSVGSSPLFQQGQRGTASTTGINTSTGFNSKYGASDNPVQQPFQSRSTPVQQPQETNTMTIENQTVNEAPAASGKIAWVPSRKHPYLPAAAPSVAELWLRRHGDGTVEPFIKERNPNDMDYERHAPTSFGPLPKGLDLSHAAETMKRIEQGVQQLNKAQELPKEEREKPEYTTYIKNGALVDTSEASAWLNGALDRLQAPDGRIPDVYRMCAVIADPIVTRHDETDAVRDFGNSKTFIELREKLNASVNEISPELWGAVNTKLTVMVNRVLKMNMGLTSLAIDSFVADIQDLINVLAKKGELLSNAFEKHTRDLIRSAFVSINEEHKTGFTENLLEGRSFAENAKPSITFLTSNYSFTYLNSMSYELDIELVKNAPAMVTQTLTPVLNDMLASLFKDVEARGNSFERHLISTLDGRILEAFKGYIGGDDVYLLTLVK